MRNVARATRFIAFTDDPTGLDARDRGEADPADQVAGERAWAAVPGANSRCGRATSASRATSCFSTWTSWSSGRSTPFFDLDPGKLAIIRDWGSKDSGNSSVMRFPAGGAPHLVDNFEQAPLEKRRLYSNEQVYLTRESGLPLVFWPSEWCPSFKATMMPHFPLNHWKNVEIPAGARIVVFTGHPRPHEAARGKMAGALVQEGLQERAPGDLAQRALALSALRRGSIRAMTANALGLWKGSRDKVATGMSAESCFAPSADSWARRGFVFVA